MGILNFYLGNGYGNVQANANNLKFFSSYSDFNKSPGLIISNFDLQNNTNISTPDWKLKLAYDGATTTQSLTVGNFSDDWNIFATNGNDKVAFMPGARNTHNLNGHSVDDIQNFNGKIFADLKNGNDIFSASYQSDNYKIDLRGGNGNDSLTAFLGNSPWYYWNNNYDTHVNLDIKIYGDAGNDQIFISLTPGSAYASGDVGLDVYAFSYTGNILLDGGTGNDILQGSFYSERIFGGSGADVIRPSVPMGPYVLPSIGAMGFDNEIDIVAGGLGSDVFVAAQSSFLSYRQNGNNDYLHITDFSTGDRVRFEGTALTLQDFVFSAFTTADGTRGLGMFSDEDSNGKFSAGDDLIVFFAGITKAPSSNSFQFL